MTAPKKEYDVVIIGGGPVGLAFALSVAKLNLTAAIIDKQSVTELKNPAPDGREIALTHYSLEILKNLNVLNAIPQTEIFYINEARVVDGHESHFLQFGDINEKEGKLAALVSSHLIKKALYSQVIKHANITIYPESEISNVNMEGTTAKITLEGNSKITAKLLAAADSRFSKTRKYFGINCLTKDMHKTMLVARIGHSLPHQNIAYECFRYGKTMAILPLKENTSSIVITAAHDTAAKIMNLPQKEAEYYIEKNVGNYLGQIKIQTKFHSYPLICTYTEQFTGNKLALLGDAAVGMHPVTAHGLNFGLKGQDILAEEISNALKSGLPINSDFILAAYQRRQSKLTQLFFHFTNSLAELYTSESKTAKVTRSILLKLANRITPIKNFLTEKLH